MVVEVDLTSDKAKNDMIQVTSEHLCKLIQKTYSAQALLAKTDLGEEELNVAYDEFYQLYPGGEISEQQFLLISKVAVEVVSRKGQILVVNVTLFKSFIG